MWIKNDGGYWVPVMLLIVGFFSLFSRGTPWQGEWVWTVDWANGITILTGPLLAGVVAYHTQRTARKDWNPISYTAIRPGLPILHQAIADWMVASACHLIVLLVALTMTAATRPSSTFSPALLMLGPIVLLAFAAVGALSGLLIRSIASAPLSAIVAFALTYLGATGAIPALFRVGGSTGSLVGLTANTYVNLAIAAFSLCFSVVIATVVVIARAPIVRLTWVALGTVGMVIAASSYVALKSEGGERYVLSKTPIEYVCKGAVPGVCMASGTTRQLDNLATSMQKQAQVLTSLGIRLPANFYQEVPNHRPDPHQGLIIMATDAVNASDPNPSDVADYLSLPAACQEYYDGGTPPEIPLQARAIVADLIRSKNGLQPFMLGTDQLSSEWMKSDRVDPWLKSTYVSLESCELDALHLPF
ncbi:hypothetical protein [Actinoplanes cyaneus]|nr:hypothetical protein [Actinoplanes cyaneus]